MLEKATGWISFMPIHRTNSNKNEGDAKVAIEKKKKQWQRKTNNTVQNPKSGTGI